jgi:hypothetical protein
MQQTTHVESNWQMFVLTFSGSTQACRFLASAERGHVLSSTVYLSKLIGTQDALRASTECSKCDVKLPKVNIGFLNCWYKVLGTTKSNDVVGGMWKRVEGAFYPFQQAADVEVELRALMVSTRELSNPPEEPADRGFRGGLGGDTASSRVATGGDTAGSRVGTGGGTAGSGTATGGASRRTGDPMDSGPVAGNRW